MASKHVVLVMVTKPTAVQIQHLSTTVRGTTTVKHMTTGLGWTIFSLIHRSEDPVLAAVLMDRLQLQLILRK